MDENCHNLLRLRSLQFLQCRTHQVFLCGLARALSTEYTVEPRPELPWSPSGKQALSQTASTVSHVLELEDCSGPPTGPMVSGPHLAAGVGCGPRSVSLHSGPGVWTGADRSLSCRNGTAEHAAAKQGHLLFTRVGANYRKYCPFCLLLTCREYSNSLGNAHPCSV